MLEELGQRNLEKCIQRNKEEMSRQDMVKLLKEYGIKPSKWAGQHFLIDERVAWRQIEYANVSKNDVVLEIGAGLGSLTEKLERVAGKVYAVERDERLCEVLRERCERAEIIQSDFLKVELPRFNKVVANIPYKLSSVITYRLLTLRPKVAVIMYQKEFAERMAAKPRTKQYGRLSVLVQFFADVELLEVVPRRSFFPPPKVDSAIVRIKQMRELDAAGKEFLQFVSVLFSQRRKKLKSSIRKLGISERDFDGERRPEELSPEELWELFQKVKQAKA
ncbi:16S rRNA (adenine(1518)-N(6)/adenine(1519)-N(6))-dimethyltransferase RsmA [Candidatus Alkanophaga liquidiphilum]